MPLYKKCTQFACIQFVEETKRHDSQWSLPNIGVEATGLQEKQTKLLQNKSCSLQFLASPPGFADRNSRKFKYIHTFQVIVSTVAVSMDYFQRNSIIS